MARLLGPDPSTRWALRYTAGRQVEGMPGRTLTVFTDEACTTPASIAVFNPGSPTTPGAVISGSTVKVTPDSLVPLFWFPDGVDTLWAQNRDGDKLRLVADVDARLDAVGTGGADSVHKDDLFLNVRDHGVTGDGVTDDTAAINALFAGLPATGGATVYWPSGDYLCNTATSGRVLYLGGKRDINIVGAHTGVLIRTTSTVVNDFFLIENMERFSMSNLRFGVGGTAKITNMISPTTTDPGSAHFHSYHKVSIYGPLGISGLRRAWDGSVTSGSPVVWSAQGGQTDYQGGSPWVSAPFSSADVGRIVSVNVPGKDPFTSPVVSVSQYNAVLASNIDASTLTVPLVAALVDTGGGNPPAGGFTVNIDNELFYVSSGGNTATLTCTSRGRGLMYPAATHTAGAAVVASSATLAANLPGTVTNATAPIRVGLATCWIINGWGVGSNHVGSGALDLAGLSWTDCVANGVAGASWVLGNGTTANVLNMRLTGCASYESGWTVHLNGTNCIWDGGGTATNLVWFKRTHPGQDVITIRGVRADGAAVFWESAQQATVGPAVSLEDIEVNAFNATDGIIINHSDSTSIYMKNIGVQYPLGKAVQIITQGTAPAPCYMVAENVVTTSGSSPFVSSGSPVRRYIIPGQKKTAPAQTLGPDVVGGVISDHKMLLNGGVQLGNMTEPASPASGATLFASGDVLRYKTPTGAVGALSRGLVVDVRDYGATGSGTTDDTAAIQAAFDALPVAAGNEIGGGCVLFPKGVYLVNTVTSGSILSIVGKANVRLVGVGTATRIRTTTATATNLLRITDCPNFGAEGILFQAIGTAQITHGLNLDCSAGASVHNDRLERLGFSSNGGYRTVFDVCTVSGSPTIYSSQAVFTSADVGGFLTLNSFLAPLFTTILSVATMSGTLAADITSSATTLTLTAPLSGAPASGFTIAVDSERMLVTGGGNTTTLTVSRGRGLAAVNVGAAHTAGAAVVSSSATLAANAPTTITNGTGQARIQPGGSAVMQNGISMATGSAGSSNLDFAGAHMWGIFVNRMAVAGIQVGNGTPANILDHVVHGLSVYESGYGVYGNAAVVSIFGGEFDNNLVDYKRTGVSGDPLVISGIRTETAAAFYEMTGNVTAGSPTTITGLAVASFSGETGVIRHENSGPLLLQNASIIANTGSLPNVLVVAAGTSSAPCVFTAINVGASSGNSDIFSAAVAPTCIKTVRGFYRMTATGVVIASTVVGAEDNQRLKIAGGLIRGRTTVADVNYTVLTSDMTVAYTSLTAARVATLPAQGATLPPGQEFVIKDESGACDGTKTITITPAAGTIDGAASLVLATAYAKASVYTNGTNWFTR